MTTEKEQKVRIAIADKLQKLQAMGNILGYLNLYVEDGDDGLEVSGYIPIRYSNYNKIVKQSDFKTHKFNLSEQVGKDLNMVCEDCGMRVKYVTTVDDPVVGIELPIVTHFESLSCDEFIIRDIIK